MSIIRANKWLRPSQQEPDGVVSGVPIKITEVKLPQSAASGFSGGYQLLSQATTANTNQITSFTYTPVLSSSYILYIAFIECDRSSNTNSESLYVFINNTPYSESYTYPRVSGHEPWMPRTQQGVYTNTNGGVLTFSIRARNGGGWSQYIGNCGGTTGGQIMQDKIQIFEYLR